MIDVNLLKKVEILDRFNFRCHHRHSGITHPACFEKARGKGERIGFLDIESGGSLDADWGFAFCYCIKALNGGITEGVITPAEVRKPMMNGGGGTKDKRLLEKFCRDVWKFDTLVVYFGKDTGGRYQRHDVPFMRTRAAKWGVEGFPAWKQMKIIDVFDIIKGKFKLSRRSMRKGCELFGIPCKSSPFVMEVWQDALAGHKPALDYILGHCREDVVSLEKLYKKVIGFKGTRTII